MKKNQYDSGSVNTLAQEMNKLLCRDTRSPEEIKRATMHSTNKAFERYFQIEADDLRTIYGKTRGAKETLRNYSTSKNGNVLKFNN